MIYSNVKTSLEAGGFIISNKMSKQQQKKRTSSDASCKNSGACISRSSAVGLPSAVESDSAVHVTVRSSPQHEVTHEGAVMWFHSEEQ